MYSNQYISEILLSKSIDKNSYISDIPIVKDLMVNKKISLKNKVTFIVGENGTGKSTFLEAVAIAYGFNSEGGTKNFNFATSDSHSELYKHITIVKKAFAKDGFFLRAESFYNVASYIDEVKSAHNYGAKSLHQQSHGESFLSLVQNRFSGNGLYILDEPEAALSPMRQLALIIEINKLVNNNSQFIIATHSPILMAFPNAEILEISQQGVKSIDFRDTEHYEITKYFLNNPEKMLQDLLED